MSASDPIVYLNGRYMPASSASISVDERGMLYADGVYEVIRCYAGVPFEMGLHVKRIRASLEAIRITVPGDFEQIGEVIQALLEKNDLIEARVYWQITRGAAPRNPLFPAGVSPTVLVTATEVPGLSAEAAVPTLSATLMPDERWSNCWIKSLMLLPNLLAHNTAREAGFDAAILHRDGAVTEATNANALAVIDGELWTHPADRWILNGVTRQVLLELTRGLGVRVREERFTTDQLTAADEVVLTGTTLHVAAVTRIGDAVIGDAAPGPVTKRLHDAFIQRVTKRRLNHS